MNTYRNAYFCMAASILLSSVAQLSMKISMLFLAEYTQQNIPYSNILFNHSSVFIWLFFGLSCYAISMLFWLFAIARLELSLAYPMLSLSYVLVYFVAINWSLLGEHSSWTRSIGIFIIILGVVFISRSNRHNSHPKHNLE